MTPSPVPSLCPVPLAVQGPAKGLLVKAKPAVRCVLCRKVALDHCADHKGNPVCIKCTRLALEA